MKWEILSPATSRLFLVVQLAESPSPALSQVILLFTWTCSRGLFLTKKYFHQYKRKYHASISFHVRSFWLPSKTWAFFNVHCIVSRPFFLALPQHKPLPYIILHTVMCEVFDQHQPLLSLLYNVPFVFLNTFNWCNIHLQSLSVNFCCRFVFLFVCLHLHHNFLVWMFI